MRGKYLFVFSFGFNFVADPGAFLCLHVLGSAEFLRRGNLERLRRKLEWVGHFAVRFLSAARSLPSTRIRGSQFD